jgi:hypothetical protein
MAFTGLINVQDVVAPEEPVCKPQRHFAVISRQFRFYSDRGPDKPSRDQTPPREPISGIMLRARRNVGIRTFGIRTRSGFQRN